jgi:hypothetical protein
MKIGKLVDERKVGDRLILDKTINCISIKEYISLWEGRFFGMAFMVEKPDKMNVKLII